MLTAQIRESLHFHFQKPVRAIFSGSSQSGKTYLIGQILENQKNVFNDFFNNIVYHYPLYLDEPPVDFHENVKESKAKVAFKIIRYLVRKRCFFSILKSSIRLWVSKKGGCA